MYLTGFADEASTGLDGQIKATLELGWSNIESRAIDGVNIHDISDEAFDIACAKLDEAQIKVNCFGSTICNWGKQITDPFDITVKEIERTIPRMHRLNSKLIRIMSYAVLKDRGPDDQMEEERFRRLREVVKRFKDAGITPVHENCMNYGGMGYTYTLKLVENVPGLRLVFDTGNPVFADDFTKPEPYPKQSSWEFYSNVKDYIDYIHIKDGIWDAENQACIFTYCGEGDGDVKKIMKDLIDSGYDGGTSIEPHLKAVFHESDGPSASEKAKYDAYVEYGRRMESMIKELGGKLQG
jgi:sugar phosphate isomerase/epimerase